MNCDDDDDDDDDDNDVENQSKVQLLMKMMKTNILDVLFFLVYVLNALCAP